MFFLPWINIVGNINMEMGGVSASGDAGKTASGFGIAEITPFGIAIYVIPIIIIIFCFLEILEDKKAYIYLGLSVAAIILMFVVSGMAGNIAMNADMGGLGNVSIKVGKLIGFWLALVCNVVVAVFTIVKDFNAKSGQGLTDSIKNMKVEDIASQVSGFAGDIQKNVKNVVLMECPHCHQQILPGKKFCPKCGGKIEANNSGKDKESQYNICMKCGSKIAKGKKFCEECGEPIHKNEMPGENFQVKVCPNCGIEVENGKKFCGDCGTKMS